MQIHSSQLPLVTREAIEFLTTVLPSGPFFYAASCWTANNEWKDTALKNIQDIAYQVLAQATVGNNTYFALSAFTQGYHTIVKPNGQTKSVFRTQDNAAAQKCLWLDIDCGKNASKYATSVTALNALTVFLKQTKLPLPYVISSGHGLHVYWVFQEAIHTTQWRRMAALLKALCVYFGFDADHSRTVDAASVLRVPGTYNYDYKNKYGGQITPVKILIKGTPTPVLTLATILVDGVKANRLHIENSTAFNKSANVPVSALPPAPAGLHFDMTNEAFAGPPKHPFRIIKECKQIQTAGFGTYTQWYNMMLVMKHCTFGEQAVHDISKTDSKRYDYNNVQNKYQQAVSGGAGPCRCDTFNAKDPGICTTCPYWGKITTPLQLGETHRPNTSVTLQAPVVASQGDSHVVLAAAAPTMTVTPFSNKDYSVYPGQGVIWHKRQLVAGDAADPEEDNKFYVTKDVLICDAEIYIHSIVVQQDGQNTHRSYVIRKQVAGRAPEDILLSVDADLSQQSMLKWLGNHAMLPVSPKYNKAISDFMSTYLALVQNRLPEIYTRDHFGWVTTHDKTTGESYEGFVIGDQMYSSRGVTPVRLDARAQDVAKSFHSKGYLEIWKHIPKMYRVLNQPFPALMVGTAFAAPFMRYGVGVATNVAYSLWDIKGGKGKSTVLEAAASVWGDPTELLQSKNDTPASRFQKYAVHKNLPIFIDEITNIRDNEASDLIYDIVNGREKSRSTAGGTGLTKQGRWDTITLFTSNKSLYEMLRAYRAQSNATHMRVIEMQCDFQDYTGTEWQRYIAAVCSTIRNNYGSAGPEFIKYCFAHPEVFEEVRRDADFFAQEYMKSSDERFWLYGLGITLAAIRVAVRAGYLDYDVDGWLKPYVVKTLLPSLRGMVKQAVPTGANLLSDYLNEHLANTLSVAAASRPVSTPDTGVICGLDTYVKAYPQNKLYVRVEVDTNTYYVNTRHFQTWAQAQGYSVDVILQELETCGIWKQGDKLQIALGKYVSAVDRSRVMAYRFILPK